MPTFIQVIELTEWEETEYWAVVSAVFEGKTTLPDLEGKPTPPVVSKSSGEKPNSDLVDIGISNKVSLKKKNIPSILISVYPCIIHVLVLVGK